MTEEELDFYESELRTEVLRLRISPGIKELFEWTCSCQGHTVSSMLHQLIVAEIGRFHKALEEEMAREKAELERQTALRQAQEARAEEHRKMWAKQKADLAAERAAAKSASELSAPESNGGNQNR